nr:hypothetical protein [uncultured Cohaesibacter sp.]
MNYLAAATVFTTLTLTSAALAFGNGYGMGSGGVGFGNQGRWVEQQQNDVIAQNGKQVIRVPGQGRGLRRGITQGNRSGEPVFVDSWDSDEDGIVTLQEAKDGRNTYFDSLDENEDGIVVAAEFSAFLTNIKMPPEDATNGQRGLFGMTLSFNDANKDGRVDREEFLNQTVVWLNVMDRNGDGKVSNDDFGPRRSQMGQNRGWGQGRGMSGQGMGRGMRRGMGAGWM